MMQPLYDTLWRLATSWVKRHLARRVLLGKEEAARLNERFGLASRLRPAGKLIWLHGASVGESLSLLPLVERLRALDAAPNILVTTGTVTSARLMAHRLPPRCLHQYLPLDRRAWVSRFLDHWRPDGVLWVESELWPAILAEVRRRRIPAALLNARISEKSAARWRRFPRWSSRLAQTFQLVTAQTAEDATRWHSLGGMKAQLLGNLKFVSAPLPADAEALAQLHGALGNRPVWLFASAHPGEEQVAGAVHRTLQADFPGLLTILVPRHPERGTTFATALRQQGLQVAQRMLSEPVGVATEIYLADTLGELGLFFRLCRIVAIGNSFIAPGGGHNPIEPAQLSAAVLYGPHMQNFAAICQTFETVQATLPVANGDQLASQVAALMRQPHEAAVLGQRAEAVAHEQAHSATRIWQALAGWRAAVGLASA